MTSVAGARRSTRVAWSTHQRARPALPGNRRRGAQAIRRRGRRWGPASLSLAQAAPATQAREYGWPAAVADHRDGCRLLELGLRMHSVDRHLYADVDAKVELCSLRREETPLLTGVGRHHHELAARGHEDLLDLLDGPAAPYPGVQFCKVPLLHLRGQPFPSWP